MFLSALTSVLALSHLGAATILPRSDTWGGSVSLGPTKSHIIHAVTTLIPGPAPKDQNGMLFLWPGMSNGTGDLIQTTLESWPGKNGAGNSWCGASSDQWCVRASLFGGFGQLDGTASPVSPTDQVKIDYKLGTDGITWTQTVTNALTKTALSSFSHTSGPMTGYGTGTECNEQCTGTSAEQKYLGTTITLASSDPDFGNTISKAAGASYSGLTSNADHTVWTIKEILVPAME